MWGEEAAITKEREQFAFHFRFWFRSEKVGERIDRNTELVRELRKRHNLEEGEEEEVGGGGGRGGERVP